ncbi:MAG: CBS domain-containing protein [Nakamurella sp.]
MIVQDVLATKGSGIVTVTPTETVEVLVEVLARHGIGAAVVSGDGVTVAGIVSERDIARGLHTHGTGVLALQVSSIMTADVKTCAPEDEIADIARVMTQGRFRHLPVVVDAKLVGIVSIGDVVKKRIDQLETESGQLMDYLTSS